MRKKKPNSNTSDATQYQRAAKPDELLMVCNDNHVFGRKFAEIFRGIEARRGKANE
ncbi:hypothetical protein NFB70_07410 [Yersinia ruckeri]|uniref:hypothetical protein n=1 Tax=Yersinia TaxID=629 RepID=UPI000A4F99A7|nr:MULTISPECIES: hypothetical protein [Yersinia]MCW6600778.1 hypothetical protein [Yersinia ruckeri]